MKLTIQILTTLCCIDSILAYQHPFYHNSNEIALRRQDVSYSTKVNHGDPNHPDQVAQSSVNVNLNPKTLDHHDLQNNFSDDYKQTSNPQYLKNPQTQLFNVGYSVSFKNNANRQATQSQVIHKAKLNLDDGEIITGTRKLNEKVDAPNMALSTHEYVTHALLDKKQKISGIKPKGKYTQSFTNTGNTQHLLSNANLSPTTQKYLKALEDNKAIYQSNQQAKQQHQRNYSWRNLSPSVEIVRSSEIPVASKYMAGKFNHAGALGRSESFDYSNALDGNNDVHNNNYQLSASSNAQSVYNEISNGNIDHDSDDDHIIPPISSHLHGKPVRTSELPQVTPVLPSDESTDFKGTSIYQQQQIALPKLPIDTTLLRDPIITTDINSSPSDNPAVIPIHFDIRPIQEAMKSQMLQSGSLLMQQSHYPLHYPLQESQNYYKQQYYPIPAQIDQMDYQKQQYSNVGYKIYGKPQPMKNSKPHQTYYKGYAKNRHSQRQPRLNPDEELLQTKLRPPPMVQTRYQRRASSQNSYIQY